MNSSRPLDAQGIEVAARALRQVLEDELKGAKALPHPAKFSPRVEAELHQQGVPDEQRLQVIGRAVAMKEIPAGWPDPEFAAACVRVFAAQEGLSASALMDAIADGGSNLNSVSEHLFRARMEMAVVRLVGSTTQAVINELGVRPEFGVDALEVLREAGAALVIRPNLGSWTGDVVEFVAKGDARPDSTDLLQHRMVLLPMGRLSPVDFLSGQHAGEYVHLTPSLMLSVFPQWSSGARLQDPIGALASGIAETQDGLLGFAVRVAGDGSAQKRLLDFLSGYLEQFAQKPAPTMDELGRDLGSAFRLEELERAPLRREGHRSTVPLRMDELRQMDVLAADIAFEPAVSLSSTELSRVPGRIAAWPGGSAKRLSEVLLRHAAPDPTGWTVAEQKETKLFAHRAAVPGDDDGPRSMNRVMYYGRPQDQD